MLEEVALQSPWMMVWLWIDEAQAMADYEFLFLRDIQNDLRMMHADLVVFLSGEAPYFSRRLCEMDECISKSIRERFANERLTLDDYQLNDVQDLFAHIDQAVWPVNSEITWTQFFFPVAYEAGYRLVDDARKCMKALADEKMLQSDGSCQIRLLRSVVARFFLDNTEQDASGLRTSLTAWQNAALDARPSLDELE
ncbi:hypothetical protein DF156_30970 [Burkholderia ubonensis]|nr:hypothetical protein DF155_30750 [Burkholderia ubonensis]RQP29723.1 hypothetical protein DF154_31985 [Burkholderia ubonensis]RQP31879.1 hypothetical protein DF156_30970 [Burkholderia ubonensis]RQP47822.1 hypothetical protein DF144_30675 [Burkholderia ubonensis]RQP50839.1 hypothetical protein DF151_30570 [Burkholderia ubonensis]